jgi:hypothetical protein
MKILVIKADYNDADYVYRETNLDDGEWSKQIIDTLTRVIPALKSQNFSSDYWYNWNTQHEFGDCGPEEMYKGILTKEDIEIFNDVVPSCEEGIHTIESIRIMEVAEDLF